MLPHTPPMQAQREGRQQTVSFSSYSADNSQQKMYHSTSHRGLPQPRTPPAASDNFTQDTSSVSSGDEVEHLRHSRHDRQSFPQSMEHSMPRIALGSLGPNDDYEDGDVPKTIICELLLTVDDKPYKPLHPQLTPPVQCHVPKDFKWFKDKSYDKVKDDCEAFSRYVEKDRNKSGLDLSNANESKNSQNFRTYLRYGYLKVVGSRDESIFDPSSCRFGLGTDDEVEVNDANQDEGQKQDELNKINSQSMLHRVAIKEIFKFVTAYHNQRFRLKIYCDYGYIQKEPDPGDTFKDMMGYIYNDKSKVPSETVCGQQYISMADLAELTTPSITRRIVEEDFSHLKTKQDKDALIEHINSKPASTLLAVCVWSGIRPTWFQHFLGDAHGFYDNISSLPNSTAGACGEATGFKRCSDEMEKLLKGMHMFFASAIWPGKSFKRYEDNEIVPVSFVKVLGQQGEPMPLGRGAFSHVFNVKVDIMHNTDTSNFYALKRFLRNTNGAASDWEIFRKEVEMLLYLAHFPHEHLLTHITSWEQRDTFYILYHKARDNLRKYMSEHPQKSESPDFLNKQGIHWFFNQVYGLVGAVDCVHQLRPDPDAKYRSRKNVKEPVQHGPIDVSGPEILVSEVAPRNEASVASEREPRGWDSIAGIHHDIKLDNILAFGRTGQLPTLKLSDFGSGKLCGEDKKENTVKPTSTARGTATYHGPEYWVNQPKGRPFDIWALGCTFLEMVLWFLGEEAPLEGKSFATLRGESFADSRARKDYFWQKADKSASLAPENVVYKTIELNKAVVRVLEKLDRLCNGLPAFTKLLKQIRKMLRIQPKHRIQAPRLLINLKANLLQLIVSLTEPNFSYATQFEINRQKIARGEYETLTPPPRRSAKQSDMSIDLSTVAGTSAPPSPTPEKMRMRMPEEQGSAPNDENSLVGLSDLSQSNPDEFRPVPKSDGAENMIDLSEELTSERMQRLEQQTRYPVLEKDNLQHFAGAGEGRSTPMPSIRGLAVNLPNT